MTKAKKEKKHVMINFYSDWCKFCRKLDNETFKNENVKKILQESFIPIKVNANSSKQVVVDGKRITEKQVAREYLVRAYPITWFLKPSGEKLGQIPGYIPAKDFLNLLVFVKDDLYEKMTYEDYLKSIKKK